MTVEIAFARLGITKHLEGNQPVTGRSLAHREPMFTHRHLRSFNIAGYYRIFSILGMKVRVK